MGVHERGCSVLAKSLNVETCVTLRHASAYDVPVLVPGTAAIENTNGFRD